MSGSVLFSISLLHMTGYAVFDIETTGVFRYYSYLYGYKLDEGELRAQLPRIDADFRAASERVGAAEATLAQLDGGARAAELGAGVESRRAELRGLVEQYAVVTLSRALCTVAGRERARDLALGGGDDYELLLAVPPARFAELASRAAALNLTLTAIGELRRGNSVQWALERRSYAPAVQGYSHFR